MEKILQMGDRVFKVTNIFVEKNSLFFLSRFVLSLELPTSNGFHCLCHNYCQTLNRQSDIDIRKFVNRTSFLASLSLAIRRFSDYSERYPQ